MVFFKFLNDVVDERVIPVIPTQVGVPVGGHDFKDTVCDGKSGNVKGASAQIIDSNFLITLLV